MIMSQNLVNLNKGLKILVTVWVYQAFRQNDMVWFAKLPQHVLLCSISKFAPSGIDYCWILSIQYCTCSMWEVFVAEKDRYRGTARKHSVWPVTLVYIP